MSPQTFVFIGRSGCGKGTQANLLQKYLKEKSPELPIFYLETGEGFRELIKKDNYTAKLAKKIYDDGGLEPGFLSGWVWSNMLIENLEENEHLILDGTPRAYEEALVLNSAMKFYNRKPHVIYINVGRSWAEERLSARGRQDDLEASDIKKRLDWFDSDVLLAVEYFRQSTECNFIEINGERSIEEVHKDLISKLAI